MSNQSETLGALAGSLSAFQAACEAAPKNATNPHLKNKYADQASIWDAIRGPLGQNGLAVIQLPTPGEKGELRLVTKLVHKSGEWVSSEIVMPLQKSDPQGYGSALTYARRYALAAILGVTQDDDDADAATRPSAPRQSEPAPAQAAPKAAVANADGMKRIKKAREEAGMTAEDLIGLVTEMFGGRKVTDLNLSECAQVVQRIGKPDAAPAA